MKKPKLEDFRLKSIKIQNGGGSEVEWSYMFSDGNEAHTDHPKVKRTLNVHDDLYMILSKQKPNILRVEEINYRLMPATLEKMGINNLDEIKQVAEGMNNEAMLSIEITGIKISGSDNKTNAVITYKKITGNKKIAGRTTTAILLSGNVYGFEEELEADIEELRKEVYDYIYTDKHSESAQGTIWEDVEENLEDEIEEE